MKKAPKIKMSLITYLKLAKQDLIGLRTRFFQDYGDIASYQIKGDNNYYLRNPKHMEHILKTNQDNYFDKHPLLIKVFCPFTGKGINFNNNPTELKRDRSIVMTGLEPAIYYDEYANTIVKLADDMLNRWRDVYKNGQVIHTKIEISDLIINVIASTLFTNTGINSKETLELILEVSEVAKIKLYTLPLLWPFSPARKRYHDVYKRSKIMAQTILKHRLQQECQYDDIIGLLLHEYNKIPEKERNALVGDQIVTLFAVSYFTTSALVQWILVELSLHPEIERRLQHEIDKVIGNRAPTFADIKSLPYLSAFVKEVLRLHPTMFGIMRQARENDVIDGFDIEKGAGIIASVYHVHRHPEFWVNPDGFDPERFSNNPLGQDHPFAYLPFGAGKRNCIGSSFSTMEATLIAIMIIQKCHLFLLPHTEIKHRLTTVVSMCPDIDYMQLRLKE